MSGAELSILIYHRVLARPDPLFPGEVDRALFERQLRLLKRFYTVLPLSVAVQRLRDGSLPPRAACITFDDGYADNAEHALPLLRQYGLHATFFIATGYLNGGQMWNDRVIDAVRRRRAPPWICATWGWTACRWPAWPSAAPPSSMCWRT